MVNIRHGHTVSTVVIGSKSTPRKRTVHVADRQDVVVRSGGGRSEVRRFTSRGQGVVRRSLAEQVGACEAQMLSSPSEQMRMRERELVHEQACLKAELDAAKAEVTRQCELALQERNEILGKPGWK